MFARTRDFTRFTFTNTHGRARAYGRTIIIIRKVCPPRSRAPTIDVQKNTRVDVLRKRHSRRYNYDMCARARAFKMYANLISFAIHGYLLETPKYRHSRVTSSVPKGAVFSRSTSECVRQSSIPFVPSNLNSLESVFSEYSLSSKERAKNSIIVFPPKVHGPNERNTPACDEHILRSRATISHGRIETFL